MSILELIAGPILKIVDKIIPDPTAKAQMQIELLKLQSSAEFKEIDAQLEMARNQTSVNVEEAKNANIFVSGWRPFIGWTCGFIFVSNYIGVPLLAWLSPWFDIPPPPRLDIGEVLPVLLGMLGLGGLRTAEKIKGTT
jgi:hypothetical protein